MKCLVTGASGFIGSALIDKWLQGEMVDEIVAVSRFPAKLRRRYESLNRQDKRVSVIGGFGELPEAHEIDAVVNLAGEPILDRRWSESRKRLLYDSRLGMTAELLQFLSQARVKPKVLISGSAIGYYGNQRDDRQLGENEEGHPCFAHHLCHDWENKAMEA
mgnify:CR=1 FL=1